FGSGISLFIAAGVSKRVFLRTFNWVTLPGQSLPSGALPAMFKALSLGLLNDAFINLSHILATVAVFLVVVYTQSMKVEIPLSFGRVRGHGMRWPLNFFYTSNIPVILVAALLANVQLLARATKLPWLSSLASRPNLVEAIINNNLSFALLGQSLLYVLIFVAGSLLFGFFWVQTASLDPRSQARNIMNSGLQIPGFRKDERVLERMLARYIWPLTFIGSVAVGLLASLADLTGALGGGTGILLTVMIVYQLYQQIAQQHVMDMSPMMRKFMGR
ncbi:preprotein translocase subunit SecY, partial [Candidatus Woesearchaeota archaeon]